MQMVEIQSRKTIFCDIDGTLLYHHGSFGSIERNEPVLLPGAKEKLDEWCDKGYIVVLTTARPMWMKELTCEHLRKFDLRYHYILTDMAFGERVVINDCPCRAINVKTDKGISDIEL